MKNIQKIIIILFLIIFVTSVSFVFKKSEATTETGWSYNILIRGISINNGLIGYKGPTAEADCNKARSDQLLIYTSDPVKYADYSITACEEKTTVLTPEEVTPIDGVQDMGTYSNVYYPLAPLTEEMKTNGIKTDDIGGYFNLMVKIAIGLCGALAVIMFVINGITYMGDESIFGKTQAKERMLGAVMGLLIALGSWALLNTINPDLLGGKGLTISQAKIEVDMEVHGDTPQAGPVNGSYCNKRATANAVWRNDIEEQKNMDLLKNNNIKVQRSPNYTLVGTCEKVGDKNCTSLTGLNTSKLINFKTTICPNCEVVINGGTECWLHSPKTDHFKGNSIVDFDDTPSLNTYLKDAKKSRDSKDKYDIYEKDGIRFLDEGNHYHIMSW